MIAAFVSISVVSPPMRKVQVKHESSPVLVSATIAPFPAQLILM